VRRLDLAVAGVCLGAWLLAAAFLLVPALRADGALPANALFAFAAAVGWLAGNLYVQGTRSTVALRRVLLPLYLGGPPGLVWLYWSWVPLAARLVHPLAPLWALGVFAVFFLVPVTLREFPRRR
jgi:hypothetical protein